ncbi:MAG: glycosyltransferase family 87 protein [Chthoniobacterales bacterium]
MQIAPAIATREPLWRRIVIAAAILIVLASAFRAISKPWDGDFKLHWEFGRRFLTGEFLYAGGHDLPYPPFWAMAHAPAAFLSMPIAKAILFPIGIAALAILLGTLRRLAAPAFSLDQTRAFWVAAAAIFLSGRFVIRDMAELGVNTALVTLSWLAIYLWTQRRDLLAGTSLGLAIALKCTPVIFVGYFLWKRQWRMVAATCAATAFFTLSPIVWQGPTSYCNHMSIWSMNAWKGFGSVDPSVGVLGPEPPQNMALRPALARYLMHLPAEETSRAAQASYVDFLDMRPATAGWVIRIILIVLLAAFMWWSRKPFVRRDDPRLLWEFAAVSILMLLVSPITWGQHCVALIPPCYFISALIVMRGELPRWMVGLLVVYLVFVPLLSRDLVGRDLALLLGSYHVETFSILGLLAVVLGCPRLHSSDRKRPA